MNIIGWSFATTTIFCVVFIEFYTLGGRGVLVFPAYDLTTIYQFTRNLKYEI
jgi:hypothetical protein